MEEWKEYRLGDIGTVKGGKRLPKGKMLVTQKTNHPYIRIRDLDQQKVLELNDQYEYVDDDTHREISRYIVDEGDVLISIVGTIGLVSIVGKSLNKANLTENCVKITNLRDICNDYLYYYLVSRNGQNEIKEGTVGAVQPKLPIYNIQEIKISAPDLETQHSIASILSSLDDKIAVNKKICENLEAQAQALFKSWFVDFAPFKDGQFVESELGLIPEGWRVGKLGEYVDNLGGYSYKGSELQPSTIAMATIKNFVRGGGFKIEGYKEIVISKNLKDYQYINLFDVLVAHTDLTQNAEVVGNPAIILSTAGYEKLIMSMDLTKVVPKDKRLTAPLIHSILNTSKFKEHALGYVNGTTVLHMSKKAVPEYKLAMPNNLDIIKELSTLLDDLYSAMSETYAENLRLSSLRDTLLPKLMSGQIKINEIEKSL